LKNKKWATDPGPFFGGRKIHTPHFGPLGIAPGRAQGAPLLLSCLSLFVAYLQDPLVNHRSLHRKYDARNCGEKTYKTLLWFTKCNRM